MSAKHTPGPWRVSTQSPTIIQVDYRMIGSDAGKLIGSACGYPDSGFFPTDEEAKANAHLIAAAPELLEFVKEWLERQGTDDNYMTRKARALLSKIQGEGK